ncbi:unnamed protein product [Auanema sp. JU1783]|nr:unnamed protein product [Auanema sp. JU1783]
MNWKSYFPPLNSRSFLGHYLPASGAVSHTLFAVHIFNPTFVSRIFPVGDLAVSNSILFNANLGIGFYVYFRNHLHRLNSWDRVEFSVFASTLFNFGSLLGAVLVKALLPHKTPTWAKTILATCMSVFLLSRGKKYLGYIDERSNRASPSPRRTPELERNGSLLHDGKN